MERRRIALLLLVFAVSLVLLGVGMFLTEHEFYARVGDNVEQLKTSDPIRIREWSFS
jgi:hypothetical protein